MAHSYVSSVAIRMAITKPKLIDKLVLVDSAGIRRQDIAIKLKKAAARIIKPLFIPQFMQGIRTSIYSLLGAEDYLTVPAMRQIYQNVIAQDLTGELNHVSQNTLIIWGENDRDTPLKDANLMHEKISNSRLE